MKRMTFFARFTAFVINAGSDSDVTSLREADLIDAVGNDTVIKGLLDSVLAEELVSRYAIDIDFDILQILSSGNLYVEIKTGPSPEFSGVDRKDPDIRSIGYHSGSMTAAFRKFFFILFSSQK